MFRHHRKIFSPLSCRPLLRRLGRQTFVASSTRLITSKPDRNDDGEKTFTTPNLITMARMAASPGISWLILHNHLEAAIVSLCLAGLSDWVDGYIARNTNQTSVLGSILDPLADKVLVAAVAIPLGVQGCLPGWLVALVLLRDVSLIGGVYMVSTVTLKSKRSFTFKYEGSF